MRYLFPSLLLTSLLILLCPCSAAGQSGGPILISQPTSTRAIAFESPSLFPEPFSPESALQWGQDRRTRVMLFTLNLSLEPGEQLSAVKADAEDGQGRHYDLAVEYLGPVPGQEWMSAIVLRLNNDLGEVGDVLVRVTYRNRASNRVRIGIGRVGGGPPDDTGSAPTPAPPYKVSGRVTAKGVGLGNVLVTLNGPQSATARTDATGAYSFTVGMYGSYTVAPSLPFYNFGPQSAAIDFLTGDRTLDFTGTANFKLTGRLTDEFGAGLGGVALTLTGPENATFLTAGDGTYSFTAHSPGDYTLKPADNSIFTFTSKAIPNLASDLQTDFKGARRSYSITGQIRDVDSAALANMAVTLVGNQTTQTVGTNASGIYTFANVKAGFDYTITSASSIFTFDPRAVTNLSSDVRSDIQAARRRYKVSGRLWDERSLPVAGLPVLLSDNTNLQVVNTDSLGAFTFTNVEAGRDYGLVPVNDNVFIFSKGIQSLSSDLQLELSATRRTYIIKGQLTELNALPVADVPVTLGGNQSALTARTNSSGLYTFTNIKAGYAYTVSSASDIFNFAPGSVSALVSDVEFNIQAVRRRYTISGRLSDESSSPISSFSVTLSGNNATQTAATNYLGDFVFTDIEAGRDYRVAPADGSVFAFERSVQNLSADQVFLIGPARQRYTLGGRVLEGAKPVAGATVSLNGWSQFTATTAADGSYSFANLEAGRDYILTLAKPNFSFAPQFRQTEGLRDDTAADFQGIPTYRIAGRVTDERGRGLAAVTLTLAGAEGATAPTANDGTYNFTVHSTGDYTVTAASEQNFFNFSPAQRSLQAVQGDRTADFAATLSTATDPAYVLEYDGDAKTVDCGVFWPDDKPLGHFFWEVWAMPGADAEARYMISDGYGGIHALLFGFGERGKIDTNRYQILGNFWTGSPDGKSIYFGGDDGPAPGEWGHMSVGWDGRQIVTYFNGVPVGRVLYGGERWCAGYRSGGGKLLIGGSDHNNLDGRIAQVRGTEDSNPREAAGVTTAFAPEALFSRGGSNYLSYFFRPSPLVADLSDYYQGQAHPGLLRGVRLPYGIPYGCPDCPPPQFVVDPTAPKFLEASPVNDSAPAQQPLPAPADALVFDSFNRANSTYTFGKGGMGSTEGGSTGPQPWRTLQVNGLDKFGILNGRAVVLANEGALAWVPTGSADGDVRVTVERHRAFWGSGLDTGLAFRVRSGYDFFFAYTSNDEDETSQNRKLTVGYYSGGVRTDLVRGVSVPGIWSRLEVLTRSDGQITVSTNLGPLYSTSTPLLARAAGAGLFSSGPGRGLLNRWDNFAVYAAH